MNKERIDDLIDILSEEYSRLENTFVIKNNQQLNKYLDNPENWTQLQLKNRNAYRKLLIKDANAKLKNLNSKAEKVFLLSYKEVAKDQIEITEKEIVAKNIPSEVKEQIKQLKNFNTEQIANLANETLNTYSRQVQIIDSLKTPDNLYDVVKKQMSQGVQNGIKVRYNDGKTFSWKAYMEMNIRTTIHQEMSENQINVGAKVGQIFYICDSFADCAPDHADYQGKIYYNAQINIPPEIQSFIKQKNILSMQEVMKGEPYLTTRPNCRHNFHAIPLEEALGTSAKDILNKYKLSSGKYKNSNYEKRMQQRKNERTIRKFKLKKENYEMLAKTTNDKSYLQMAKKQNQYIRKWQSINKSLVENNKGLLKRDYDRENIRVITQDLGVRYDYKFKDGEPIKR